MRAKCRGKSKGCKDSKMTEDWNEYGGWWRRVSALGYNKLQHTGMMRNMLMDREKLQDNNTLQLCQQLIKLTLNVYLWSLLHSQQYRRPDTPFSPVWPSTDTHTETGLPATPDHKWTSITLIEGCQTEMQSLTKPYRRKKGYKIW